MEKSIPTNSMVIYFSIYLGMTITIINHHMFKPWQAACGYPGSTPSQGAGLDQRSMVQTWLGHLDEQDLPRGLGGSINVQTGVPPNHRKTTRKSSQDPQTDGFLWGKIHL